MFLNVSGRSDLFHLKGEDTSNDYTSETGIVRF